MRPFQMTGVWYLETSGIASMFMLPSRTGQPVSALIPYSLSSLATIQMTASFPWSLTRLTAGAYFVSGMRLHHGTDSVGGPPGDNLTATRWPVSYPVKQPYPGPLDTT